MPACASWDFESGTPEGFFATGSLWGGTNREVPSAFTGLLEAQPRHATSGTQALAVGFQGDGVYRWMLDLRIGLCPGTPLELNGHFLKFDLFAETGVASPAFTSLEWTGGITLYNDEMQIQGTHCETEQDTDSDVPVEVSCQLMEENSSLGTTHISFIMKIDRVAWRGTVYFDNIRIEPPP